MASNPSLAFFGSDLTGAAEPGTAPWAQGPATPVTPPASILPDPNVMWLDPGLLMEPGTGFGSAQKQDVLGQAITAAQQFLDGGGGRGGGKTDIAQAAGGVVDAARKALGERRSPADPSQLDVPGTSPGAQVGTFMEGTGPEAANVGMEWFGSPQTPADIEAFSALLGAPPGALSIPGFEYGGSTDIGAGGNVPAGSLNYGGALLPAAGAGLSLYGGVQGLTSGDTTGQIAGAAQTLQGTQQAIEAYKALTATGQGAAAGGAGAGGAGAAGAVGPTLAVAGSALSGALAGAQGGGHTEMEALGNLGPLLSIVLGNPITGMVSGGALVAAAMLANKLTEKTRRKYERRQERSETGQAGTMNILKALEGVNDLTSLQAALGKSVLLGGPHGYTGETEAVPFGSLSNEERGGALGLLEMTGMYSPPSDEYPTGRLGGPWGEEGRKLEEIPIVVPKRTPSANVGNILAAFAGALGKPQGYLSGYQPLAWPDVGNIQSPGEFMASSGGSEGWSDALDLLARMR